jgi:hypothetical protein
VFLLSLGRNPVAACVKRGAFRSPFSFHPGVFGKAGTPPCAIRAARFSGSLVTIPVTQLRTGSEIEPKHELHPPRSAGADGARVQDAGDSSERAR